MKCLVLAVLIHVFNPGNTFSQQAELGASLGLTNYQGDLTSFNFQDGFQLRIHPEIGLFLRWPILPVIALRGDLRYTRISGDDALASSEGTRKRNLHFRSPILQAYLSAEVYPLMLFFDEPPRLNFYLSAGAGILHFNPKARYEGDWVALHPLNTEGQGLPGYPGQEEYSLLQLHLPFGGGLRYELNATWSIGAELCAFFVFTDYLDDVSTIYISYPELLEARGPLTAALANREGEYLGSGPVIVPTGTKRGSPDSNDFLVTASVTVQCKLNAIFVPRSQRFKKKCPKF